ncbi:hypothetical protein, partial [Salmonella sp. s54925]|uniref:hypothetical protein n=1 Tax=Salmonella sp. s54925 TaxID=3159674 RepID=UPI00397F65C7
ETPQDCYITNTLQEKLKAHDDWNLIMVTCLPIKILFSTRVVEMVKIYRNALMATEASDTSLSTLSHGVPYCTMPS